MMIVEVQVLVVVGSVSTADGSNDAWVPAAARVMMLTEGEHDW